MEGLCGPRIIYSFLTCASTPTPGLLELSPVQRGVVSIFGVASRFFVAMNSRGKLFGVVSTRGGLAGHLLETLCRASRIVKPTPHPHARTCVWLPGLEVFSQNSQKQLAFSDQRDCPTLFLPAVRGYLTHPRREAGPTEISPNRQNTRAAGDTRLIGTGQVSYAPPSVGLTSP